MIDLSGRLDSFFGYPYYFYLFFPYLTYYIYIYIFDFSGSRDGEEEGGQTRGS